MMDAKKKYEEFFFSDCCIRKLIETSAKEGGRARLDHLCTEGKKESCDTAEW
jgi:hypothetical protein